MVVAGGGSFVAGRPRSHLDTNAGVVEASGAARVDIRPDAGDPQRRCRVIVAA